MVFPVEATLLGLSNLVGFVSNCFVLSVASRNQDRRARSPGSSNVRLLILSMTLADFIYCSFVFPMNIYYQSGASFNSVICVGYFTLARFSHLASVLSLLALNVDKFLYIAEPFRYGSIVTRFRIVAVVAMVWICSFILSGYSISLVSEDEIQADRPAPINTSSQTLALIGHSNGTNFDAVIDYGLINRCRYKSNIFLRLISPIVLYIVPVFVSGILSIRILFIVLRHHRNLNKSLEPALSYKYSMKLWRAVCFVLVTTAGSIGLILPYWVVYMADYICDCVSAEFQSKTMINFMALNAVVNPLVTIFTQKPFRRALWEKVGRLFAPCPGIRSCLMAVAIAGRKLSQRYRNLSGSGFSGTEGSINMESDEEINILVQSPERIRLREERHKIRANNRKVAVYEGAVVLSEREQQPVCLLPLNMGEVEDC